MHAASEVQSGPRPGRRGGQRGGAAQPGQQVAGSVVSRRGRVSRIASGWPSSHSSSSPNDRRSRRALRGRERGEQVAGVLGGLGPVQPAHRDPADLAQPVLLRAAGDDHRAPGVIPHPVQEPPQRGAARLIQRRGRARPGRASPGPTRSCPTPAAPGTAPAAACTASSRCGGSSRAKSAPNTARPIAGDHPVQAEGGHAGLERMPQHQPRVIHPAGIPPPPGEPLGQLGLPRPPGPASTTTRCSRAAASSW